MAKDVVKQIRKNTRRRFSADEKIRIVVESPVGWVIFYPSFFEALK